MCYLFNYNLANQTISAFDYEGEISLTCKIGELFVDFLNTNYEAYNKKRILLRSICISNNWLQKFFESFPSEKEYWDKYKNTQDCKLHNITYVLNKDAHTPYFSSYINFEKSVYFALEDKHSFDLKFLQKHIIDTYVTCVDIDQIKSNSSIAKYMKNEGLSFDMTGLRFTEETVFRYKYTTEEAMEYAGVSSLADDEFEAALNPFKECVAQDDYPDFMKHPKVNDECAQRDIEIIHGYIFETVQEALQCEFLKMLELGIKIRKCAVCGKYFIVTGHNGKCCDNLYKDTGLTCQQVFSDRNYKNKRKQNPILKEYDKAYKRMYARYSNKKNLSSKEYSSWREKAIQERDKALEAYNRTPSETIVNEFKQFLGNK